MSALVIESPEVFERFLQPSRYKGAHGGRGSGKSHFFASQLVARCVRHKGHRVLCGRQVQKSLKESAMQLVKSKIESLKAPGFRVLNDHIETPGGGVIIFQGLAEHTAETIKSYEGFDIFWLEEAHTLTERTVEIIRPTLRNDNSELWFSWNRRRKSDPVDRLLTGANPPPRAIVIKANWRDNPWFPTVLEEERRYDEEHHPDTYQHVWEGDYAGVHKGAYYAQALTAAQLQGRVGHVAADPLVQVRAFWDLGISDATAIWVAQFVGKTINVLDYIEGEGQALSYYVSELRARGWGEALCVLPHDGARRDSVQAIKFEDHLKDAGFKTKTIANQGQGAARLRVEAARRMFPRMWFNAATTEAGREALGAYHERRDDKRDVGLGPEHDWASNGADAFGLMAVAFEGPKTASETPRTVWTTASDQGAQGTAWLGS